MIKNYKIKLSIIISIFIVSSYLLISLAIGSERFRTIDTLKLLLDYEQ
jgi:hypothetical protein